MEPPSLDDIEALAREAFRTIPEEFRAQTGDVTFLVTDFAAQYAEANQALAKARADGNLQFREDVMDGIENMPAAFLKLLTSDNFGKQLIKI